MNILAPNTVKRRVDRRNPPSLPGSGADEPVPVPTDIENLIWWTNFQEENVTKDGSDLISQADDLSGNGYHFAQAGSDKAHWIADPPVGEFRTADTMAATLGAADFPAFTIFAAVNIVSVTTDSTIMGATLAANESTGAIYLEFGPSNRLAVWVYGVGRKCLVDVADACVAGTRARVVVTYDGTTIKLYINGVLKKSDAYTGGYFPYRASIGKCGSFSNGSYDLGDNGGYSRVLTSDELADLEEYLADGYSSELDITTPSVERLGYQRQANNLGTVPVAGTYTGDVDQVRARLVPMATFPGVATSWSDMTIGGGNFSGSLSAQPGYYTLEIEGYRDSVFQGSTDLDRVAVGECFITAGQSLSVSAGQTEHTPASDMVNAMTALVSPRLAYDPQPNDSASPGGAGSCWPDFGDYLVNELNVPVFLYSVGCGNTSSAQWLPGAGTGHYERLAAALAFFGVNGIRGILWQQGESDVATSQATYESNLTDIIEQSRTDAGWEVPWLIARSTFVNGVTLPNVQAAYAAVIAALDGVYEGADTDAQLAIGERYDGTHPNDAGQTEQGELWGAAVIAAFELSWSDPADIADALGYWDAALDVTTVSGGVSSVGNQVAGGPAATQATSGKRMTMGTQDGHDCFVNDGVDDELNVTLSAPLTAHSKWAIVYLTASAAFDLICGSEVGNNELNFEMANANDVDSYMSGVGAKAASTGNVVPHSQTILLVSTYDGTTLKHYLGTTEIGSQAVASGKLETAVNWFGSAAFESLQGKIKAFGLTASAMSSDDRSNLHAWAQANKAAA